MTIQRFHTLTTSSGGTTSGSRSSTRSRATVREKETFSIEICLRVSLTWGVPPSDGEGNAYQLPGRDLVELTVYLQSKLLWSTERNSTALLHHFLDAYYGAAAPHVLSYMTTMIESMRAVGMCRATGGDGGEGYPPTAAFLTPAAVVSSLRSFAAARAAVAGNPTQLGRVDRAKLGVYYVVLLRWSEMRAYSEQNGLAWAAEPTVDVEPRL